MKKIIQVIAGADVKRILNLSIFIFALSATIHTQSAQHNNNNNNRSKQAVTSSTFGLKIFGLLPAVLTEAAKNGDTELITAALNCGVDINSRSEYQMTPLMHATAYGKLEAARLLLDRGADCLAVNSANEPAYKIALQNNKKDIAQLIYIKAFGPSALLIAADAGNTQNVKELIALGVDVNAANPQKGNATALIAASFMGHTETVRTLIHSNKILSKNIFEQQQNNGMSAIFMAISKGHKKIAAILLGEISYEELIAQKDYVRQLLLATKRNLSMKFFVCCRIAVNNNYELFKAIALSDLKQIKKVIKEVRDVHMYNKAGNTPLHEAVLQENKNSIEIIGLLLSFQPKLIDIPNKKGEMAVDLAVGRIDGFAVLKLFTLLAGSSSSYGPKETTKKSASTANRAAQTVTATASRSSMQHAAWMPGVFTSLARGIANTESSASASGKYMAAKK